MYLFCENFGVLRHVARYFRHETGQREVDLYEQLRRAAAAEPWRWPAVSFLVDSSHSVMASPGSWRVLLDEVHAYLVEDAGLEDDAALATVLDVQHALLPSPDREFPHTLELAHDYIQWHQAMMDAKFGEEDWTGQVPHLRDLPRGTLTVDDPLELCHRLLGSRLEAAWFDSWELDSPIARPGVLMHINIDDFE
jgi:hypothetical protein